MLSIYILLVGNKFLFQWEKKIGPKLVKRKYNRLDDPWGLHGTHRQMRRGHSMKFNTVIVYY